MKHTVAEVLIVCAMLFVTTASYSKTASISVPMSNVNANAGDRGTFYVFEFSIPEEVTVNRLDAVILEFAVDATALSEEDSLSTPTVGVYPVATPFVARAEGGGSIALPEFEEMVPSSRPVAQGAHRVLRMAITDIVKGWLKEPESNHGLVIGTLAGPDVGTVSLNDTFLGAEVPIRVTFVYRAP